MKKLKIRNIYSIGHLLSRKEKSEYFRNEILLIKDEDIRGMVDVLLNYFVPDYFFTVPASGSGKYHPNFALGYGGLVRHTQMAVKVALDLFRNEHFGKFNQYEQDCAIAALILHDGWKNGTDNKGRMVKNHPELMALWIREAFDCNYATKVANLVETHMGQWGARSPLNNLEKLVHMADYISSRKYMKYKRVK